MTTPTNPVHSTDRSTVVDPGHDAVEVQNRQAVHVLGGLVRIFLGWIFLWAFIDKLFGLGYATASKDAWINGGSPTFGFLNFGAAGPLKGVYNSIAGAAWADWLFMAGLLGIGVALLLGVFMNIAAAAGALLLVLMWSAVLPPENNPVTDEHIVYALTLGLLAGLGAGRWLGLGRMWEQTMLVRTRPYLR